MPQRPSGRCVSSRTPPSAHEGPRGSRHPSAPTRVEGRRGARRSTPDRSDISTDPLPSVRADPRGTGTEAPSSSKIPPGTAAVHKRSSGFASCGAAPFLCRPLGNLAPGPGSCIFLNASILDLRASRLYSSLGSSVSCPPQPERVDDARIDAPTDHRKDRRFRLIALGLPLGPTALPNSNPRRDVSSPGSSAKPITPRVPRCLPGETEVEDRPRPPEMPRASPAHDSFGYASHWDVVQAGASGLGGPSRRIG